MAERREYTAVEDALIKRLWMDGITSSVIGIKLGRSGSSINSHALTLGLPPRRPGKKTGAERRKRDRPKVSVMSPRESTTTGRILTHYRSLLSMLDRMDGALAELEADLSAYRTAPSP